MRPVNRAPAVTAGLTWLPDTGPMKYTSASSVRPNASAVATTPAATLVPANLKPNIRVATPQATYTKIAVPRNSTASFRIMYLPLHLSWRDGQRPPDSPGVAASLPDPPGSGSPCPGVTPLPSTLPHRTRP